VSSTSSKPILAVDLGGTTIKFGIMRNGTIIQRGRIDSHSQQGIAQALERLADASKPLLDGAIADVALAIPTFVDSRTNRVLMVLKDKFDGLREFDLATWAKSNFGGSGESTVRIENDAHAALLGEWRAGAGRGKQNLVMITLGTGIGTSVIIGGKPLRGPHAQAGNFGGHFVIDPHGYDCPCGNRGCVEAMQNVPAINAIARADSRFASSSLKSMDRFDYADLFEHSKSDELAASILTRSLDLWGALVVSLIHQFAPDRVIIGGGVMRSHAIMLPHLQRFADRAMAYWKPIDVVAAGLGDDAALIGMASLIAQPPEFI
jgi:glucokinase